MDYKKIIIHTDGGSRGNPGPSAIGVVIENEQDGKLLQVTQFGKVIPDTTNNVAEYSAVIGAFSYLLDRGIQCANIEVYMDSQLVVSQLTGRFKITKPHLKELFFAVKNFESKIGQRLFYKYIPREQNAQADALVNKALDESI